MRVRWLMLAALSAASPVAAQNAVIVLRAADTALVRREAAAGRHAEVVLDGLSAGRFALAGDEGLSVRAGLHRIAVELHGYVPFRDTVRVEAGARALVTVVLERPSERVDTVAAIAAAQELAPPGSLQALRGAVVGTSAGAAVRFELADGRQLAGTLGTVRSDTVAVMDQRGAQIGVPYADVTRYSRRGRATVTGALVGAIPGTVFGVLVGLAAVGACETPGCADNPALTAAGIGVLFGGLAAGVGAIFGLAVPQWHQAWRSTTAETASGHVESLPPLPATSRAAPPVVPSSPGRFGELTALMDAGYAGYGATTEGAADNGAAAGASLGMSFRVGVLAFGPEVGLHGGSAGSVWSIAAVTRTDLRDGGHNDRVPYVVVGVGAGFWSVGQGGDEETGLLTGTLGLGATFGGRWRVEARWNPVLQYSDPGRVSPTLVTAGIGRVLTW